VEKLLMINTISSITVAQFTQEVSIQSREMDIWYPVTTTKTISTKKGQEKN
jgi:hypothetical protein